MAVPSVAETNAIDAAAASEPSAAAAAAPPEMAPTSRMPIPRRAADAVDETDAVGRPGRSPSRSGCGRAARVPFVVGALVHVRVGAHDLPVAVRMDRK